MTGVPADWIRTALEVTGHFEDSSDPLGAVTGDFDGMGISLGVLQWNIGSNSLQPMVLALARDEVVGLMPRYGADLWRACSSDVKTGLAICRQWQTNRKLNAEAKRELKAFTRSEAFIRQQIDRADGVARSALASTERFAQDDPRYQSPTKALFCWFFDLHTQNGGLKGLRYADVDAFLRLNGTDGTDDVICAWLAGRTASQAGYRDSHENARLWKNKVPDERVSLFVLSYLRSQLSKLAYRADTMNRKATIAVQRGWVHREQHDLTGMLA